MNKFSGFGGRHPGNLMSMSATVTEIGRLTEVLRPLALERVRSEVASEVVQETIARVLEVRHRLRRDALEGYARATARNLIVSDERRRSTQRRLRHKLLDVSSPVSPEEVALLSERRTALQRALERLPDADRVGLLQHDAAGVTTVRVARSQGVPTGTLAVRLHRARARLRVEYLLEFERVSLPTSRCRPTLVALSAGLGRGKAVRERHLAECDVCRALAASL